MENSLKQRIVGAVVLIALAVIFLPAILKEKTQKAAFESQIPVKPVALTKYPLDEPLQKQDNEVSRKLGEVEQAGSDLKDRLADNLSPEASSAKDVKESQTNASKVEPSDKSLTNTAQSAQTKTVSDAFVDAAWVIQVASFSNRENAEKLVEKLKAAKYKAYRRDGKTRSGQSIFRIYVGPYIEKSPANKQLEDISKLSQSKALLLVFDPLKH